MRYLNIRNFLLHACLFTLLLKHVFNINWCHSSCAVGSCSNIAINDPTKCTSCYSEYITYMPLSTGIGTCNPNSNYLGQQNIQLLQYVSTSTMIGSSYLSYVDVDGTSSTAINNINSAFGLSGYFQYSSMTTTFNVRFSFSNLGLNHYGIYARVSVQHDCDSEDFIISFQSSPVRTLTIATGIAVV